LEEIVENLKGNEVVLLSPVGSQSLDFYFKNAIVYESFYVPGQFEQFIGRMTRYNATYNQVNLWFLISENTIEEYFYVRFWELMQSVSTSKLKDALPSVREEILSNRDKQGRISFSFLKALLLWREE
jgi:hypothetical protein